ncbi:hypothetical protein [Vreelandella populi]|uniref:Uncharacterized protein n=1 Tax=Vreelandella populi TaxID=2498858 RepID=A0A433LHC0_9GAMM|nr:hypothetical protein [Halomonas populi]RUR49416.1 hypothetical protein ELY37_01575 [Halomonas populi]
MKIGPAHFNTTTSRREHATPLASRLAASPSSNQASATESPLEKRLKKQKEAFEALASLPSPKESAMQNASQKVGFLKQRLESLKAMMRFASPEQLKSMASELKSIARELGVAARHLSGGSNSTAGPTVAPSVNAAQSANSVPEVTSADSAHSEGPGSDAQGADTALANAEAAISAEIKDELNEQEQRLDSDDAIEKTAGESPALGNPSQRDDNRSPSISASEHALRSILTDARKELQEAINELKIRLREEDKEARRELKKAEEDMAKLDRSLAQATSNALYSSLGQMLPTATADVSVATSSIHIAV